MVRHLPHIDLSIKLIRVFLNIISKSKRSVKLLTESLKLIKNMGKTLSAIEVRLDVLEAKVSRNWIIEDVQLSELRAALKIGELLDASSDSGSEELSLPVFEAHAELNGEPVDSSQLYDLLVSGPEAQLTNQLGDITDLLVSEHWDMPHELVKNVWLWSVVWSGRMSDELGRAESSES